jgi:16S rRNA (uracil1498-N3)-methyltransferase
MNAAKQARRAWVPLIELATSTAEVAAAIADAPVRIALHEEADTSLAEELPVRGDAGASANEVALVIGPEGGISLTELEQLSAVQVVPAKMGSPILRSSTAGTVALGWVMGATGSWTVGD